MENKLPEKLHLLRKHFGFSQQDLADKMGVSVVEYMGWENGRSICNFAQFKRLASIFQISIDELINNKMDIQLPNLSLEDSVQIPFIKSESVDLPIFSSAPQTSSAKEVRFEETAQVKKVSEVQEKPKPVKTIQRVDPNQKVVKKSNKEKQKLTLILAGLAVVVVLAIGAFFIFGKDKNHEGLNLKLAQNDRFTMAEKFSVYIRDNQTVQTYGQGIAMSDFIDVVQVSARSDFAIGLKSDGTVVSAGSNNSGQLDVKDIKNAVDVSAGKKHTVAALQDGSVACVGDTTTKACDTLEWVNIVDVEAGDGFTIGIDKDGNVRVAGTVGSAAQMEQVKNVASAAIGNNEVAFVSKSQTVSTVAITGNPTNVSTFKNISQVAVGNNFVAGLTTDGKVQISTTDEALKKTVESWTNVAVISANNLTLAGFNTSGKMMGAGDNQNNLYANEVEPESKDTLEKVKNVQVSMDKTKLKITWDKVEGADYYEVSISTNPVTTGKYVDNSMSIDLSKLVDGEKYTIKIVTGSNVDKELNSEEFSTEFTYTAATPEPTATPAFTLTIKYVYDDNGSKAYQDFTQTYNVGDEYKVDSPNIEGYTPSIAKVEGKMGQKNEEITVRYMKKATPTPTPSPTPTPTPTATPLPTDKPGCDAIGGTFDEATNTCTVH